MNIYLIKNGQNAGPYTMNEVLSRLNSGMYAQNDFAWYEGCDEPMPLSNVLAALCPTAAKGPAASYSPAELAQLAQYNTLFTATFVLVFILAFIPTTGDFEAFARAISVCLSFMALGLGWRLVRSLKRRVWVWLLLLLIPFLSWFFSAYLIWLAFKTLKENREPCGRLT